MQMSQISLVVRHNLFLPFHKLCSCVYIVYMYIYIYTEFKKRVYMFLSTINIDVSRSYLNRVCMYVAVCIFFFGGGGGAKSQGLPPTIPIKMLSNSNAQTERK